MIRRFVETFDKPANVLLHYSVTQEMSNNETNDILNHKLANVSTIGGYMARRTADVVDADNLMMTPHTCLGQGAFDILDPNCARCQEIAIERSLPEEGAGTTVTIQRAALPLLPQGETPVRVPQAEYEAGLCKKRTTTDVYENVTVTYTYKGKQYHGCLSFEQERKNPQGQYLGTTVVYVLYPTVAERDAASVAAAENRRRQEELRQEIRRMQSGATSDLIGPNGLPANPAAPSGIYGGYAGMPPTAGMVR